VGTATPTEGPLLTSPHNPVVRAARALQTPHGRRKARACLIEGRRLVEEALRQGASIERCFYVEAVMDGGLREALRRAGVPLHPVTEPVLRSLAETATPQGLVAVVRRRFWSLDEVLEVPEPFLLILDGVQEPGNVGTLLRAAWAAGADGAIFLPGTADPYQGKAIRASAGALFRLRHTWHGDPGDLAEDLARRGVQLWVAEAAGGEPPHRVDLRGPTALVLGSEARGASAAIRARAQALTIPMVGGVDSLNVAMAGAMLLYERCRQRGFLPPSGPR